MTPRRDARAWPKCAFPVGAAGTVLLALISGWWARGVLVPIATPPTVSGPRSPGPPCASSASASAPALPLAALAARGDLAALKALESRPPQQRSTADALAIARGHSALKRQELAALGQDLIAEAELRADRSLVARLHTFARDEEVALEAYSMLAELPDTLGPDMLHALWRERGDDNLGILARDLLDSTPVRQRWSPALTVELELRERLDGWPFRHAPAAERARCDALRPLLERVRSDGDRRIVPLLKRLAERGGCDKDGNADCFHCLRSGRLLDGALARSLQRPAPRPWILASR